jgi:hypothetical protein
MPHATTDRTVKQSRFRTVALATERRSHVWNRGAVRGHPSWWLQKDEVREAPVRPAKLVQLLEDMYGMEMVRPTPAELEAFRHQTRDVYRKWAEKIGIEPVSSVEKVIESGKW